MGHLALEPGVVIDGYEVVALLGRGGMGAVYRVRRGDEEYALKTLTCASSEGSEEAIRFAREAQLLGSLRHAGLVRLNSSGQKPGFFYFVMRLIEGESLEDRIRRSGPLPVDEAIRIVTAVADAIAHAHERGIVHRDLKPANVLLDADGRPVVTDFGLARSLGESEADRLTRTGEVLGTPSYLAPEQAYGKKEELDEKIDVYGLGALLYALLAGRPPFDGPSALATMKKVWSEPPPPLKDVPPELEAFVMRAMAKRREERPESARAFATELEALAATPGISLVTWVLIAVALGFAVATGALAAKKLGSAGEIAAVASHTDGGAVGARLESVAAGTSTTRAKLREDLSIALLGASSESRGAAAQALREAADEAWERKDRRLAARRYEAARVAEPAALDKDAEVRRLASWIEAGDPDFEGLDRHATQVATLEPALVEPCQALLGRTLELEASERERQLGRLQTTLERLPDSPLRRRAGDTWLAIAADTYDDWRRAKFGFTEDEAREFMVASLAKALPKSLLERKGGPLLEKATRIFGAFGRAIVLNPDGDRFPSRLTPSFTLVCLCFKSENTPWGEKVAPRWDDIMSHLWAVKHPLACFVRGRIHDEEAVAAFDAGAAGLAKAPRDDLHVQNLALHLVEIGHKHKVPIPRLRPLVELAQFQESWGYVEENAQHPDAPYMPPEIRGEIFFVTEAKR